MKTTSPKNLEMLVAEGNIRFSLNSYTKHNKMDEDPLRISEALPLWKKDASFHLSPESFFAHFFQEIPALAEDMKHPMMRVVFRKENNDPDATRATLNHIALDWYDVDYTALAWLHFSVEEDFVKISSLGVNGLGENNGYQKKSIGPHILARLVKLAQWEGFMGITLDADSMSGNNRGASTWMKMGFKPINDAHEKAIYEHARKKWKELKPQVQDKALTKKIEEALRREDYAGTLFLASLPYNLEAYNKSLSEMLFKGLVWRGVLHFGDDLSMQTYVNYMQDKHIPASLEQGRFRAQSQVIDGGQEIG